MIYGRRFFNKSEPKSSKQSYTDRKPLKILYRSFQLKYTLYMLAAIAGSVLIFNLPSLYFVNQNYSIFKTIAYEMEPNLVTHLEREIIWLASFFIFAFIATGLFCVLIGLKMTAAMVGPLVAIERHMKRATLGDWSKADFQVREDDDFRSLAGTYFYFYQTLRAQVENEINLLEKITVNPENKEAFVAYRSLLAAKRSQLGLVNDLDHSGSAGQLSKDLSKAS